VKDLKWVEGKQAVATDGIESVVRQYTVVKEQVDALEQEKKRLKDAIEMHMAHIGAKEIELAGFKVAIADCSRENFNLKEAIAKMGRKALAKFISETQYTQLRVKRLAGE
jgi:hypothetical protein